MGRILPAIKRVLAYDPYPRPDEYTFECGCGARFKTEDALAQHTAEQHPDSD